MQTHQMGIQFKMIERSDVIDLYYIYIVHYLVQFSGDGTSVCVENQDVQQKNRRIEQNLLLTVFITNENSKIISRNIDTFQLVVKFTLEQEVTSVTLTSGVSFRKCPWAEHEMPS